MKILSVLGLFFVSVLLSPIPVFAATNNQEITNFTNQTLGTFLIFASLAAVFFLVRGGYLYMTSSGKPDSLEQAKITIRNAVIGLVLIIGATVVSSLLTNAFNTPSGNTNAGQLQLSPIQTVHPSDGLTQVLIDAIAGFLQNIIQSATKPITDGIISFLTTTPTILNNSVIFNFWLVILGITDSLFALMIAALGFHFMSASTFGFEEIEFKHLLPRIGLAFLGANMSIFLCDWIVLSCNTLVHALLGATGGISQAWITNAFDPFAVITGNTFLIIPIFELLFLILSIVLLLFYVTRLITVALGAVLSPLIFLLWTMPKFADFAEISVKSYIVAVYTVFVQVVIIQLASSFLTVSGQAGTNSLISIIIGIGLMFSLLKAPQFMMQMVFYNTSHGLMKKVGGQIMNVISSSGAESAAKAEGAAATVGKVIKARKDLAV